MPFAVKCASVVGVLLVCGILGWIGRGVLTGPPSTSTTATVYPLDPDAAAKDGEVLRSWQVVCPSAKEADKHCEIVRDVYDAKDAHVGRIAILTKKGAKDRTLVMTVPLGVLLQAKLGFRLSGEEAQKYAFTTCDAGGCVAEAPFDKKMEKAMMTAQDATFLFSTPQDQEGVETSFSLKQFKTVYSAYQTGEAKRHSLWWRLWL